MAEFQELNQQVKEIWQTNADFWNERMGEGNDFHKKLIEPSQLRLLDLKQGERVLDVACGNGQFARKMAELGAKVVAIDIAEGMIENARARTTKSTASIAYGVVDATDAAALSSLGERSFDAAVCTMAIMDMASVGPLVSALGRILKHEGRFVFSVQHPCFNSPDTKMVGEVEDRDGDVVTEYSVKIEKYRKPYTARGLAMIGQPVPQHYFHRAISTLYSVCFGAEFVLDGIEEPCFEQLGQGSTAISWANFTDIPPVLVSRMRLAGEA